MKEKIQKIKKELSRVFDDNLHTKKWHNIVDYVIIGLILISTIEIFLSTFDTLYARYKLALHIIDIITQVFFTIEVTLRIWTADLLDNKYKGFWGRIKYCFSFYGLIDLLSTYPFYLSYFVPVPYMTLKVLRIARLFRIFRYMKSFKLLSAAIKSKSKELYVSLQFLVIITLILSFILFFAEHEAQPEVYNNVWNSVLWAFAQYIGDPGNFADIPPITLCGRIIACLIGVLGIAIFAVPAGLIGSGFTETMDEEKKKEEIANNIKKLHLAFKRRQDRHTLFQIVPKYVSFADIQAKTNISIPEIINAVNNSKEFRIRNLATTQPVEEHPQDKLVVEHFYLNTDYGCCIDRKSKITIVSTSSFTEAATSNFSYYLAKIGRFNYVSKELDENPQNPESYYNISSPNANHKITQFLKDINKLSEQNNSWVIFILSASGAEEPVYPTQFHFIYGAKKGDGTYSDPNITIKDCENFEKMYQDLSAQIENNYKLQSDKQGYHNGTSPRNIARHISNGKTLNAFTIRIAWSVTCWDYRYIHIAKTMADNFNKYFEPEVQKEYSEELKIKDFGFADYKE